jgi:hypothetical protein
MNLKRTEAARESREKTRMTETFTNRDNLPVWDGHFVSNFLALFAPIRVIRGQLPNLA